MNSALHKFGMVALLGRPNVGKSTLLNRLIGQKVSIVSEKAQTTRWRVIGILSEPDYQIAFVDTPGVHAPHTRLGKIMNEQAEGALGGVDLVVVVVDSSKRPDADDEAIARLLRGAGWTGEKVVLCLNKMDILKPAFVVENVEAYQKLFGVETYMLTSMTRDQNVDKLLEMILERLPEGPPGYPEDEFTDQPMRRLAAELVREKALLLTRQEVPHALATVTEEWEDDEIGRANISVTIVVEKEGQKAIVIGRRGQMLKTIGTQARAEIEDLLGRPVMLNLYVKVREEWRQNPRLLQDLEYME